MTTAPTNEHLKHRAIISTINYKRIDDDDPKSRTDARALSLGKSTWNSKEISAKIWRHNGQQWKGSSEEMPLRRALDCTIMILSAMLSTQEGKLENHFLDLTIVDATQMQELQDYLIKHQDELDERLAEIKLLLGKYLNSKR